MRLEYFQMVDRIVALDPQTRTVRANCVVPSASPVFEGHFPGHPLLPGVLMIETMAQTGGWLVLATLRFSRMPFLAQVKEAKLRTFVMPGQALEAEARLLHDGSGYAVVAATIVGDNRRIADAEITYRVVPFPNETLRAEMLATARRVAVPEAFLNA
ncbi:MAG TPA: 3-hydroxyacyl-ACP dehydratase FabZ family protein [Acetobacteraceae bacterium]|jgi:3-hydroxyacyl-[acyl-carrier-protein] dehydratase|nr:3-hydroxyacyl-ACP dehydratase FabZ family protein [Acetobacteraceae bacterium]